MPAPLPAGGQPSRPSEPSTRAHSATTGAFIQQPLDPSSWHVPGWHRSVRWTRNRHYGSAVSARNLIFILGAGECGAIPGQRRRPNGVCQRLPTQRRTGRCGGGTHGGARSYPQHIHSLAPRIPRRTSARGARGPSGQVDRNAAELSTDQQADRSYAQDIPDRAPILANSLGLAPQNGDRTADKRGLTGADTTPTKYLVTHATPLHIHSKDFLYIC